MSALVPLLELIYNFTNVYCKIWCFKNVLQNGCRFDKVAKFAKSDHTGPTTWECSLVVAFLNPITFYIF